MEHVNSSFWTPLSSCGLRSAVENQCWHLQIAGYSTIYACGSAAVTWLIIQIFRHCTWSKAIFFFFFNASLHINNASWRGKGLGVGSKKKWLQLYNNRKLLLRGSKAILWNHWEQSSRGKWYIYFLSDQLIQPNVYANGYLLEFLWIMSKFNHLKQSIYILHKS